MLPKYAEYRFQLCMLSMDVVIYLDHICIVKVQMVSNYAPYIKLLKTCKGFFVTTQQGNCTLVMVPPLVEILLCPPSPMKNICGGIYFHSHLGFYVKK